MERVRHDRARASIHRRGDHDPQALVAGLPLSMSLELVNALAAVGTFVVIAVTALAALIQLRHLRSSNQLAGLLQTVNVFGDPEFQRKLAWLHDEFPTRV